MKKCTLFHVFILTMAVTFALAARVNAASISNKPNISLQLPKVNHIFENKLPESVEIIEEEAFEGTAIVTIKLSENVKTIGDRAFANINTLQSIWIPISTKSIAETAFTGSNNVSITAAPNSYARAWARENKLPFSPTIVMYAGTGVQNVSGSLASVSNEVLDTESSKTQDTNRAWRKFEEIQVHDNIEIMANVIQGRAPPSA